MKIWTLRWTDTKTGETAICEVSGDICYEAHRTEQDAERAAASMNDDARHNGWSSRYTVEELPRGLRPYFGGEEAEAPYQG